MHKLLNLIQKSDYLNYQKRNAWVLLDGLFKIKSPNTALSTAIVFA